MSEQPAIRFLSIFVPNLREAARAYEAVLGCAPVEGPGQALQPHPFAAQGPVVFDLGAVHLALYQADYRGTHPGDVGIGLEVDGPVSALAQRAAKHGRVFYGPKTGPDGRQLAAFMMPDRHFFEVVERRLE